jgi:phosphohistidine phosphatase
MQVIIIRHAIAGERDPAKWPGDRDRPLTEAGERRFRRLARCYGRLIPRVDAVWSSPLKRAWQTAEILAGDAGWPKPQVLEAMEPGKPVSGVRTFLRKQGPDTRIALVGHEPELHELLSLLLTGSRSQLLVEMKKGGLAQLSLGEGTEMSPAVLMRFLTPATVLKMKV